MARNWWNQRTSVLGLFVGLIFLVVITSAPAWSAIIGLVLIGLLVLAGGAVLVWRVLAELWRSRKFGSPDVFGFAVLHGEHGPCDLYFRYDYEHRSERWTWASPRGEVLARGSLREALMALRNHPDCTKLEDLSGGRHRWGFAVVHGERWELWQDSGDQWTWYNAEMPNRTWYSTDTPKSLSDAKPMLTRSSLHEALEALRDHPGRDRTLI